MKSKRRIKMNIEWLTSYPSRKNLIRSLPISKILKQDNLPEFKVNDRLSKKIAGLYHIENHKVDILPYAAESYTPERFVNLILHEIGHSTARSTNRWERLLANTPARSIEEVTKLEEQIAETIAMILNLVIFNTAEGCNLREFRKYIITNSNRYRIPWEEVTLAIETLVDPNEFKLYTKWSNVLKKYMINTNIVSIKEGVFNGEK
jgi:hypothetical protein